MLDFGLDTFRGQPLACAQPKDGVPRGGEAVAKAKKAAKKKKK